MDKQKERDLLQETGLCSCGNWLCKSEIHRGDHQEKQAGSSLIRTDIDSTNCVTSFWGKLQFCS
jgi:hypothetical protein